jgi:hypothetical protein
MAESAKGQILGITRDGSSAYGISATSWQFVLVDLKTQKEIRSFQSGKIKPESYKVSPDERFVAAISKEGIALWDFKTGRRIGEEIFVDSQGARFQFSQDSNRIIINHGDHPAMLWVGFGHRNDGAQRPQACRSLFEDRRRSSERDFAEDRRAYQGAWLDRTARDCSRECSFV